MDKPMSSFSFRVMALLFALRDLFAPPQKTLSEVTIKPGDHVLDYGCGPGSYTIAAAKLVGHSGKVRAADIHPLAIKYVGRAVSKNKLHNVETIRSDCTTGLSDGSVDVALLYDTFHGLGDPDGVLRELHRVMKPGALLSFSDHHMKRGEIVPRIEGTGLFKLREAGRRSFLFTKV